MEVAATLGFPLTHLAGPCPVCSGATRYSLSHPGPLLPRLTPRWPRLYAARRRSTGCTGSAASSLDGLCGRVWPPPAGCGSSPTVGSAAFISGDADTRATAFAWLAAGTSSAGRGMARRGHDELLRWPTKEEDGAWRKKWIQESSRQRGARTASARRKKLTSGARSSLTEGESWVRGCGWHVGSVCK
jgi:hypothetical protein